MIGKIKDKIADWVIDQPTVHRQSLAFVVVMFASLFAFIAALVMLVVLVAWQPWIFGLGFFFGGGGLFFYWTGRQMFGD